MRINTSDLTGAALDWAVAEAGGVPIYRRGVTMTRMDMDGQHYWQPSTDWSQGGPIIEHEGISINAHLDGFEWFARDYWGLNEQAAEKPLEAAMRCYVASKLGDNITIPEALQ